MSVDAEAEALRVRLTDAVDGILGGTTFAPPDGGIVTDVVVIVGWRSTDGTAGFSYVGASTPWATEGLLAGALRKHRLPDDDPEDSEP